MKAFGLGYGTSQIQNWVTAFALKKKRKKEKNSVYPFFHRDTKVNVLFLCKSCNYENKYLNVETCVFASSSCFACIRGKHLNSKTSSLPTRE